MSDAVAKLRWDLLADVAGFTGPLEQGGAAVEKMAARFDRAFDSIRQSAARASREQEAWSKSMQGEGSFFASSQTAGGETSSSRHRGRLADQLGLGQSARVELTREAAQTAATIGDVKKKVVGELEKAVTELGEKAGLGGIFGGAAKFVNGNPLLALGTLAAGGYIEHERERRNYVREVGHAAEAWGEGTRGASQLLGAGVSEEMGSHFQRAVAEPNAVFGEMGLDAAKLRAEPLKDAMLEVADAFGKVQNPTDRAKMAVELFGKAGDEMIPALSHLRQNMDALAESKLVTALERAEIAANDAAFKGMMDSLSGLGHAAAGGVGSSAGLTGTLYRGWGMAADLLHGENPFTAEKEGRRRQQDYRVEHADEYEAALLAQQKLDAATRADAQALQAQAEAVERATADMKAMESSAFQARANWANADDRGRPADLAGEQRYIDAAKATGRTGTQVQEGLLLMRQQRREGSEIQGAWSLFGQSQTAAERLAEGERNAETYWQYSDKGDAARDKWSRMDRQVARNYWAEMGFGTPLQNEAERHAAALAKIAEAQPQDAARRREAEDLTHRQNLGIKDWAADFKKSMSDLEASRKDFTPEQFAKREKDLRRQALGEATADVQTVSPVAAMAAGSREAYSMMVQSQLNDPKTQLARQANQKLADIEKAVRESAVKNPIVAGPAPGF
jgi:hypothetical protein